MVTCDDLTAPILIVTVAGITTVTGALPSEGGLQSDYKMKLRDPETFQTVHDLSKDFQDAVIAEATDHQASLMTTEVEASEFADYYLSFIYKGKEICGGYPVPAT